MKQSFSWKSFISFGLFLSFFIILISGLVLYIAPAGRISKWSVWIFAGFSKEQWQAIHTLFSFTFAILSIFHIFTINWTAFWFYIKAKAQKGLNKKREFYLSVLLTGLIFTGTILEIHPFKAVMDLGSWAKDSWSSDKTEPPVPHAEELTLNQISERLIKLSPDSIVLKIRSKGYKADSAQQTIETISLMNKVSPAEIYNIITSNEVITADSVSSTSYPSGLGRKTLLQLSVEMKTDVTGLIQTLRDKGIEAGPDDKIKTIADRAAMTPSQIYDIIKQK